MPIIRYDVERIRKLVGVDLDLSKLTELLEKLKAEVETVTENYVEVELEVDRVDLYTHEGLARALKGLLGIEKGLPRYNIVSSDIRIVVENVETRPYVAGFAVYNVNLSNDDIAEIMEFQERVHHSVGGDRVRVAIGIHDLDKIPSREIRYRMADIESEYMKPLGYGRIMSLSQVIRETEQGRKYGSISLRKSMHPVLESNGVIISMPPVINSEETKVTTSTRNLFVDITGIDERIVDDVAALLATTLAEKSLDRKIGVVEVVAKGSSRKTPRLEPLRVTLDIRKASKLLGVELDANLVREVLSAMRMDVVGEGDNLQVLVPRYRLDILHWVDIAEEIAIAIGYEKFKSIRPLRMMRGGYLHFRVLERKLRRILVGYGFQEVYTFTLTSCREQEEAGVPRKELIVVSNPVSSELECVRATLIPHLLKVAEKNQHIIPLKVFEIGEAYRVREPKTIDYLRLLAVLIMDKKVGYEDIQAIVYGVVRMLGDEIVEVKPTNHPLLINGRVALIRTKKGLEGILGEVKPEVLATRGIEYPVAVAEIRYYTLQS